MIPLTAQQIADATAGRIVCGDAKARITCVCTDTRAMKPDSLFIAIKGDTFDGHDKLSDAAAGGSRVALVHSQDAKNIIGMTCVLVDDTRLAMGRLARFVREQFARTKVIAVAGSNGKTGTKHLIHSVLTTALKGSMSPKSFNNDIGVPLTLFGVEADDDFVVVEVGTNHPGEVAHLSRMCQPDVAVITSIGEEHMAFFKSLDGVRRENADIVIGLREGGRVLINGDDAGLRALLPASMTFGVGNCDIIAKNVRTTLDGTTFFAQSSDSNHPYQIPQIGQHHATNALVAIAIGHQFGVRDDNIRRGLLNASVPEMRMEKRVVGAITLINDAYNANPTSVRAALQTLSEIDWPGRKIVVLGEMRELGDSSPAAHESITQLVGSLGFASAIFVGDAYRATPHWFATSSDAAAPIAGQLVAGDLLLIKGSRSIKMENIEKAIVARFE